jgi:hypothetical protein
MVWLTGFLVLGVGGLAAWSLTRGQDHSAPTPPLQPAAAHPSSLVRGTPAPSPGRDASGLSPLQQQMQLSARRGADWLFRMNGPDGRFVHGYLPALKSVMEGDQYLRQAAAAFALARAARYTGEERYAARATQAVLTLLGDTAPDPKDAQVRRLQLAEALVDHLGAVGLLVMAINELPAPEKDVLEKSEQLCNYLRTQQQADGSLRPPAANTGEDWDGVNHSPGLALYGLMLSQRHRPAAWKIEVARKALAYYRPWWKEHKDPAFVPWQTAACTEAFLATKELAFAEFVCEMNDWLCGLQYDRIDARRPRWYGGFPAWADGQRVETAPQVASAAYAEALAEACRVARQQGDLSRHQRYKEALERCLQFLATLQYTDANTQHFADWYRPALLGAFHASHQDGNLRIDYTQHAVCALVQYLTHVARPN